MSAATQNEMDRLRRVNAEYRQLLEPMWAYVDQHGLAKLGELRSTALVRSHASLSQQLDEALEREAALAAHVERLKEAGEAAALEAPSVTQAAIAWGEVCEQSPATSLTRRDLIKQAEILERLHADSAQHVTITRGTVIDIARELRQRAQELTP